MASISASSRVERLADLQHGSAVGDVLSGGAPVAPFTVPVAAERLPIAAPPAAPDSRCARCPAFSLTKSNIRRRGNGGRFPPRPPAG